MCTVCRQTPCHSRCPNAEEPPIYAQCESCGAEIRDGDEYYEIDSHNYCKDCVRAGHQTAEVERG